MRTVPQENGPGLANLPLVDDALLRRIRRKETWTARILHMWDCASVEAAEREWWAGTSPSERMSMVETLSADAFGGLEDEARELRLQRSITRVIRRRRQA
jgi:hypothetical protein